MMFYVARESGTIVRASRSVLTDKSRYGCLQLKESQCINENSSSLLKAYALD